MKLICGNIIPLQALNLEDMTKGYIGKTIMEVSFIFSSFWANTPHLSLKFDVLDKAEMSERGRGCSA